jgi:opacity protein-like surface antigen
MKTTIIALSAAALVAAAPAALAQGVPGKTPGLQHKVSKKHHPGVSGYAQVREMQAKGSTTGPRRVTDAIPCCGIGGLTSDAAVS